MGTDAITFVQSAGPGSVVQGNGITITGTSIAINTAVTVDLSTAQTLTNKQLTTIELGHATDTTFTRVSAGVVAIEGNNILTANTGVRLDQTTPQTIGATATRLTKLWTTDIESAN